MSKKRILLLILITLLILTVLVEEISAVRRLAKRRTKCKFPGCNSVMHTTREHEEYFEIVYPRNEIIPLPLSKNKPIRVVKKPYKIVRNRPGTSFTCRYCAVMGHTDGNPTPRNFGRGKKPCPNRVHKAGLFDNADRPGISESVRQFFKSGEPLNKLKVCSWCGKVGHTMIVHKVGYDNAIDNKPIYPNTGKISEAYLKLLKAGIKKFKQSQYR